MHVALNEKWSKLTIFSRYHSSLDLETSNRVNKRKTKLCCRWPWRQSRVVQAAGRMAFFKKIACISFKYFLVANHLHQYNIIKSSLTTPLEASQVL